MKCEICNRDNLTEKELEIHTKYFQGKCPPIKQIEIARQQSQPRYSANGSCPDCGATLWFEEGCVKCSCGYTKC